MSNIDERIVEMRFDNKQFEQGVQQSIKSLEELNKSLEMEGAEGSLTKIESAIESLSDRFSTLGIAGMRVIQNITDNLFNMATGFAKNLLGINSMIDGFYEYETKMNAVQTIWTNTRNGVKKTNQSLIASTQAASDAIVNSVSSSGSKSTSEIRKSYKEQLKVVDQAKKDELEVLETSYEEQLNTFKSTIKEEHTLLESSHQEKLAMYNEEYMEKLKLIDEERYNKIKAIDDEIAAINAKTEKEEEELKLAKQQAKIEELQNRMVNATNYADRLKAEKELQELGEKIKREELLKQRKQQIAELQDNKKAINSEYQEKLAVIQEEYKTKVSEENEFYKLQKENLKEQENEQLNTIKKVYQEERELLIENHNLVREQILERQEAEIEAINNTKNAALVSIQAQQSALVNTSTDDIVDPSTIPTMEKIVAVLDDLNDYADKTIYNFGDMTKAVGTFTAAGVGLEDSATAIKGLANLAAASGTTTQQLSGAYTQISQALSAGRFMAIDWFSITNAQLGGALFQNALKKTAKEMGVFINESKSFKESLQDGWLTTDVMIATLAKFAKDPDLLRAATEVKTFTQLIGTMKESVGSGWAQTWEQIIGDKDEAAKFWTSVNDGFNSLIEPSINARNEMLKFWNAAGGRDALIEGLTNIVKTLGKVLGTVSKAFREVFPPMTSEKLLDLTFKFRDLTKNFKIGEGTLNSLTNIFKVLFTVVKFGITIIGGIIKIFTSLFTASFPLIDLIVTLTGKIGEFIFSISNAEGIISFDTIINSLTKTIEFLGGGIKTATTFVKDFINGMSFKFEFPSFDKLKDVISSTVDKLGLFKNKSKQVFKSVRINSDTDLEPVRYKFVNIKDTLESMKNGLIEFATKVKTFFQPAIDKIKEMFKDVTFTDLLGTGTLVGVFLVVRKVSKTISKFMKGLGNFVSSATKVLDETRKALKAYQNDLKADILKTIAISVLILAGALFILTKIDSDKLKDGLIGVSVLLGEVVGTLIALDKLNVKGTVGAGASMVLLASSILILAKALSSLSGFDSWEKTWPAITALGLLMAELAATALLLSKINTNTLMNTAASLVVMSFAMVKMAEVVSMLGKMKPEELIKGVQGLGAILLELAVFVKLINSSSIKGVAVIMNSLAASLMLFYLAIKLFGTMDSTILEQGLFSIGAILLGLSASIKLMNKVNIKGAAVTIMSMATSLLIMYGAVKLFGTMDMDVLQQGLTTVGLMIGGITASMMLLKNANISGVATSLIMLAVAIGLLIIPIKILGAMNLGELIRGLTGVAVAATALVGLAAGLALISKMLNGASLLSLAASLIMFSIALGLLVIPIKSLSDVPLENLIKSLIALMVPLAAFAAISLLLAPLGPALLIVAGAFALFGVAILGLGAGLFLLVSAFQILSLIGPATMDAMTKALEILLVGAVDALWKAIEAFAAGFITALPILGEALTAMLLKLLEVIRDVAPALVETLLYLIETILDSLAEHTPKILEGIWKLLTAIFNFFWEKSPEWVKAGWEAISSFVRGIIDKVSDAVKAAKDMIKACVKGVTDGAKDLLQAGKDAVAGFVKGFKEKVSDAVEAAKNLGKSILNGVKDFLGIASPSKEFIKVGKFVDEGFAKGMYKYANKVYKSSEEVGNTALSALNSAMTKLVSDPTLTPIITPVVDLSSVQNGIRSVFGKGQTIDVSTTTARAAYISASDIAKQNANLSGNVTNTTNNDQIIINNHYTVRNDNDIRRINQDLNNTIKKYRSAKGVPA